MTTVDEVAETLRAKLESTGALRKLRARLRADVSLALEAEQPLPPSDALPDENLLVNELIRQYLAFNGYTATLSVLMAETGAPPVPLDRPELAALVGVVDDAHSVQLPLLYELVERSRQRHAPQPTLLSPLPVPSSASPSS